MAEIYNFNSGWLFSKMPEDSGIFNEPVHEVSYDASGWENVTFPHTYNDKNGASGRTGICQGRENYYRGLACYRKQFDVEKGVFLNG